MYLHRYKNVTRLDEIKILMQGISLPESLTTMDALPPAIALPATIRVPQHEPFVQHQPQDTVGTAKVRGKKQEVLPNQEFPTHAASSQSRTTEWRKRKLALNSDPSATPKKMDRKVYTCKGCKLPVASAGHTQFRGQRYCPNTNSEITQQEWLQLKRAEAKTKSQSLFD